MKFSLDKLRAGFGNRKEKQRTQEDIFTEEKIKEFAAKEQAFAISKENVLFLAPKELGGFHYLITVVVGSFKIKTNKGATLTLNSNDTEFELYSDTDEFESEYSNATNRFITRIDFQIEEKDIKKINPKKLKTLILKAKKHQIEFTPFKSN